MRVGGNRERERGRDLSVVATFLHSVTKYPRKASEGGGVVLAHGLRVQCWRRYDSKRDPRCSSRSMEQQATLCSVRKRNVIIQ